MKALYVRDVDEWFGKEREWAATYGSHIRYTGQWAYNILVPTVHFVQPFVKEKYTHKKDAK